MQEHDEALSWFIAVSFLTQAAGIVAVFSFLTSEDPIGSIVATVLLAIPMVLCMILEFHLMNHKGITGQFPRLTKWDLRPAALKVFFWLGVVFLAEAVFFVHVAIYPIVGGVLLSAILVQLALFVSFLMACVYLVVVLLISSRLPWS